MGRPLSDRYDCRERHAGPAISVLREVLDNANVRSDRYSRNEIKFVRTIDVAALQKQIDELSKQLRELDVRLQQANWMTDLA